MAVRKAKGKQNGKSRPTEVVTAVAIEAQPHSDSRRIGISLIAVIFVIGALVILLGRNSLSSLQASSGNRKRSAAYQVLDDAEDRRIRSKYEAWIRGNAWMHPNLTLTRFPEGNGIRVTGENPMEQGTIILEVPSEMQITRQNSLDALRKRIPSTATPSEKQMVNRLIASSLQDEEIMTMRLVLENCLGDASNFVHYIAALPKHEMPLLMTFNEKELAYLRDANLASMAREATSRLNKVWETIKPTMDLVLHGIDTSSCLTMEQFRRFHTITESHGMLLYGSARIVPMADAINHNSLPTFSYEGEVAYSSNFVDFHTSDPTTGKVIVKTDRTTLPSHQLYEEYDRLDNSLHLVYFGFVMQDNPFHCVVLSILPLLPDRGMREGISKALRWDGTACVRRDRTYLDDAIVDLYVAAYHLKNPSARESCLATLADPSLTGEQRRKFAHKNCGVDRLLNDNASSNTKHPNAKRLLRFPQAVVQEAAQAALTASPTSLAEDVAFRSRVQEEPKQVLRDVDVDPVKVELALSFRVEDKKLLTALSRTTKHGLDEEL